MRRFLASAFAAAAVCILGAAPRTPADAVVTSVNASVSKLVCQSGMLLFNPAFHAKRDDKSVPAAAAVTNYDEDISTHMEDAGGPSVTGAGNINQPNVVIGPMTSDSSVKQHTTVSSDASSVLVETSATADTRKTAVVENCCFGTIASASTAFGVVVEISQRCRYQFNGSVSAVADDPRPGVFATVTLTGTGPGGAAEGVPITFVGNGEGDGGRPLPHSLSFSKSGVFEPGTITLAFTVDCDLGGIDQSHFHTGFGSHAVGSWNATFVLSPDVPGDEIRWTKRTGGAFGNDSNWLPQQVPLKDQTHSNTAVFDVPGSYTVDIGGARTSDRLVVRQGTVTFANTDYKVDNPSLDNPSLVVDVGKLIVTSGTLTSNSATIGEAHSLSSEILLTGANSRWSCLGRLRVGGSGGSLTDAKLTIEGGADVTSVDTRIGAGAAQKGVATISGSGSTWNTDNVHVGYTSPGQLDVLGGGVVTSAFSLVGAGFSTGGADMSGVRVVGVAPDGTSSEWDTTILSFGQDSFSAVVDGGRLSATDLGVFGGGSLYVVGADAGRSRASLVACNRLSVGTDGVVAVGVGGAFVVVAGDAFLGDGNGGGGSVTVDGADATSGLASTFHVDGQLQVGQSLGTGFLQISDGAAVTAGDACFVGTKAHGVGVVLADGAASSWKVTGNLFVGDVAASAPGSSGTILMNGSLVSATGDVCVDETGRILGNGTLLVFGTMYVDGFIGPGVAQGIPLVPLSPPKRPVAPRAKPKTPTSGTLTIQGNLVVGPTGVVRAEAAGVSSDRLVVTGDATLDGTLVLQFKNGFAPKANAQFELFHVNGNVTGAFATVETRGLAPGAQFDVTSAGGAFTVKAMNDTVALPTVRVTASAKKLLEKKAKKTKSVLTFARTGPTTAPLVVRYTVGGSATNGFDYVSLPGVVTIPAKKKSVKVTVQLIDDPFAEPTETIDFAVVPGADYTESLASAARVSIVDND